MLSRHLTVFLLLLSINRIQCLADVFIIPSEQFLVSDISHQILMSRAGPELNTTYLSTFQGKIPTQYSGIIFGLGKRPLISMPVRLNHKSCPILINVIFKVDTGAPVSSLTSEALSKLYENCPKIQKTSRDAYPVSISGHFMKVQESQAHFQNVNILGADFLEQKNCHLELDYLKYVGGQFKLVLEGSNLLKELNQEL